MMSGLCEYMSLIKIRASVSSSLPAVDGNVGFVRSLHNVSFEDGALWISFVPLC